MHESTYQHVMCCSFPRNISSHTYCSHHCSLRTRSGVQYQVFQEIPTSPLSSGLSNFVSRGISGSLSSSPTEWQNRAIEGWAQILPFLSLHGKSSASKTPHSKREICWASIAPQKAWAGLKAHSNSGMVKTLYLHWDSHDCKLGSALRVRRAWPALLLRKS